MALKDYDIAFTNKVKAWYSNTIWSPTDITYNVIYNLVEDNPLKEALSFPLISIYRPGGFSQNNTQTFAARKRGIVYYRDSQGNKKGMARFLSLNLPYQIDVYAKSIEDLSDVVEHLMFAFNLDQKIIVTQVDVANDKYFSESYDITYNSGPQEQSEFQNDDRVYHYSIAYDILNARILNFKNTPDILDHTIDTEVE
jgi:hypothetical protein